MNHPNHNNPSDPYFAAARGGAGGTGQGQQELKASSSLLSASLLSTSGDNQGCDGPSCCAVASAPRGVGGGSTSGSGNGHLDEPQQLLSSLLTMLGKRNNDNKRRRTDDVTLTTDQVVQTLAKEMSELSVNEREKVYDDLHGVAQPLQETPEFISKCFQEMDDALKKIPKSKRKALDRAIFLRPRLLVDRKFKLMFLRGDEYDGVKAARRLVKHFDVKLELFGDELLAKDIRLKDLMKETVDNTILTGSCLCLKQNDQTGRPVLMYDVSKFDHFKQDDNVSFIFFVVF